MFALVREEMARVASVKSKVLVLFHVEILNEQKGDESAIKQIDPCISCDVRVRRNVSRSYLIRRSIVHVL